MIERGEKKRGVDGDGVKERRWPGQVLEGLEREREKFHLERQVEKKKGNKREVYMVEIKLNK
jgi:hypothetical protein